MTMKNKTAVLLTITFTVCSMLCGCMYITPENECMITYRNGELTGDPVRLDGKLYYSGSDGIYDQENNLVVSTDTKPRLQLHNGSVLSADGTTLTEYDSGFHDLSEYELPEKPVVFTVSENSIFYTDADHVPHIIDKKTTQEISEISPESTVPIWLDDKPFHLQYYPEFVVLTDSENGVSAIDKHTQTVCAEDLHSYSSPVLSVSDDMLLYASQRRITRFRIISHPFNDTEDDKVVTPDGYTSTIEQYKIGNDFIVFTATEDMGLRYEPEDLRGHVEDCYCKIDPKDMNIVSQYLTKRFERILYADEKHFVVLKGKELRVISAETGSLESKQKTDLFSKGGDFTYETGPDTIYVFDNTTGKICSIYNIPCKE